MALGKTKIIFVDKNGKEIPFYTDKLPPEFAGKEGEKYKIIVKEDDKPRVDAGEYTVQGVPVTPPEPEPEPDPDNPPEPPIPTPDPVGGSVLWQSKGIWDNGKARTMTDHHEYDPDDKLSEVAAGGHGTPRKWEIPGDGNYSKLSGGMSRVYTHTPHDGRIMFEATMVWNKSMEAGDGNLSLEFYSRHNEGGDEKNRRGGVTVSFHKSSVESKEEYFHAEYTKGQSKDLPEKLQDGKEYPIKVLGYRRATADNAVTTLEPFIDYGQGMKSLGIFVQRVDKNKEPGLQEPSLYWRWRVNGTAPKEVVVKNVRFLQL